MEEAVGSDGGLVRNKGSEPIDKKKKRSRLVQSDDSVSSDNSLEKIDNKVVETSGLLNGENEGEKKRRLDVFEFDEYDNIDEKRSKKNRDFDAGSVRHISDEKRREFVKMRKELAGNSIKGTLKIVKNDNERRIKKVRKSEPGSSKHVSAKKPEQFEKVKNQSGGKKELAEDSVKSRSETESDDDSDSDSDSDFPILSLRQKVRSSPNESIRSQDKNNVWKVSEKKRLATPKKSKVGELDFEDEMVSKSEEITKKNKSVSFSSESKVKKETREVKAGKLKIMEARSPSRGVTTGNVKSPGNVKRGSATAKQKLREKLKTLLLDAGWKIDYRPRRSRDYLDAVYISPSGSAYWSIVKAYDAFQKHIDDDVEMDPSSLSEEVRLLTRKTQKKMEREKKMKLKEKNKKRRFKEESDADSDSDDPEDDKPMKRRRNDSSKKKKAAKLATENDDRKGRKFGRCTLLVRSSEKGLNFGNEGHVAYTGKRTLISWLIDSGVVSLNEKVKYMNQRETKVELEGCVKRGGIRCSCCSKVISVYKFEIHAGSKLRQPYQNIYLESGDSLLQCQIKAWNKQEGSERNGFHSVDIDGDDANDDTCSLCGDGGDLICCDSCPSTFHQSCLDIEMLPPGDWHCPNCICKFCGIGGTDSGADEVDTTVSVMHTCSLCEKKYHGECCPEVDDSSNSSRSSASFCEPKCQEIFDHLQKILGVKHKLDGGFSWSLINRSDVDTDESHRSYPKRVVSNSKLAVALSVMDECFLPIVDRRSGINMVNSIVYNCGSNFSRLNYSGFYTVILERGDEIVAAASIRVRGTQLAEMPFIGTRHIYRRQGMCSRLLGAIKSVLCSLKVKKLTIPAIAEHMHTWTAVFGFKPFDASHKQELKSLNMVVFPGVDMLQKFLVKKKTSKASITANSGGESILPEGDHNLTPDMEKQTDVDACADHDINTGGDEASLHDGDEMNEKSDVSGPSLPDSVVSLNGNSNKEAIKKGEDPVSTLPPFCPDQLCVEPMSTSNQLESDTDQLDLNQLDKTESKLDEVVIVCDSVVVLDPKADPANKNDGEIVSETASDKPVLGPTNVPDSENTGEAEDDASHADLPTQGGNLEDKERVPKVESELNVEVKVQPVKVKTPPPANGGVDIGHKDNGEVASVEPGLNCFTEIPEQNISFNEDGDPLSVSKTLQDEIALKLKSDPENDMAKDWLDVNAPVEPDLNSTSAEGKESIAADL